MTKSELNILVEKLIHIRDAHKRDMDREESDILADAINVIDHNIDVLVKEGQ